MSNFRDKGIFLIISVSELQCSVEFEWHTEVICTRHVNSQNGTSTDADREQSSSRILAEEFSPSHVGTIVGIILAIVIAVLAALLYFHNPAKRAWFCSWNLLNFKRGTGRVRYCRIDTTEEARLLLDTSDPTQCQTDSDDDLLHA